MAKPKGHPIVLVEWIDSIAETKPWSDAGTDPQHFQPGECRSVGWLLAQDEVRIVLYGDTSDSEYGRHLTIPMGCVKSIKTLVRA